MLIVQTPTAPAEVRNAIVDSLSAQTIEIRIASAYVTLSGSNIFFDCLSEFLDRQQIDAIPKTLVTSFDFGLTDPAALHFWNTLPNTIVRVAGAPSLARGSLQPAQAFHPKVYAFGMRRAQTNLIVGSANMTSRGLSINSEAIWAERNVASRDVDAFFSTVSSGTEPLSDELLSAYRTLRRRRPPPQELKVEVEPVPPPKAVARGRLQTFREAVENGIIDPARYRELWIQVEGLQGGSGNQLELPRGGHVRRQHQ